MKSNKGVRRFFRGEFRAKDNEGVERVLGVVYPAGTHYSDKTDDEFIHDLCEYATYKACELSPALKAIILTYNTDLSLVEMGEKEWQWLQTLQLAVASPKDKIAYTTDDNKLEVIQNGQTEERNTFH